MNAVATFTRPTLSLVTENPAAIAAAAELPVTVLGMAERFVIHYGDHTAYVNGAWRIADEPGEWDNATEAEALQYVTVAALAVVRSVNTLEYQALREQGRTTPANKNCADATKLENLEGIAGRILAHAKHLVSHTEFTEL